MGGGQRRSARASARCIVPAPVFAQTQRQALTATSTDPPRRTATPKRGEQKDSVLDAFDFSATRSKKDAELLWQAKYERSPDGKMSREQYAALRRKVGGTAKDFFKSFVEDEMGETF